MKPRKQTMSQKKYTIQNNPFIVPTTDEKNILEILPMGILK